MIPNSIDDFDTGMKMLHLKKVLGAKPKEHKVSELATLYTPWGEALDADHVLEEHPDPQFARTSYQVLNGRWQCAFVESGHAPDGDLEAVVSVATMPPAEAFDRGIVVPFSPEAPLSGVNRQLQPTELLWYRRSFNAPSLENGARLLLHFQAVDYACAVFVNGQLAGTHVGGYIPFSLDITNMLVEGENELAVCVADPSEFGGRLRDMMRNHRGMSEVRRVKAVFWWCYMHTECPKGASEILATMPTDADIDLLYEAYASNPKETDGPVEWGDPVEWGEMHHSTPHPYSID